MWHRVSSPMQVVLSFHPEILPLLVSGVANPGKSLAYDTVLVALVVWRKVVARFINRYTYTYGGSVIKVKK